MTPEILYYRYLLGRLGAPEDLRGMAIDELCARAVGELGRNGNIYNAWQVSETVNGLVSSAPFATPPSAKPEPAAEPLTPPDGMRRRLSPPTERCTCNRTHRLLNIAHSRSCPNYSEQDHAWCRAQWRDAGTERAPTFEQALADVRRENAAIARNLAAEAPAKPEPASATHAEPKAARCTCRSRGCLACLAYALDPKAAAPEAKWKEERGRYDGVDVSGAALAGAARAKAQTIYRAYLRGRMRAAGILSDGEAKQYASPELPTPLLVAFVMGALCDQAAPLPSEADVELDVKQRLGFFPPPSLGPGDVEVRRSIGDPRPASAGR